MKKTYTAHFYTPKLYCLLMLLSLASLTFAQINTWEGDVSDDWDTADNWSLGTVPIASNAVFIGDGNPNDPVVKDQVTAVCRSIQMGNSSNLTIDQGGELTIQGDNLGNISGLVMITLGTVRINGILNISNHSNFGIDLFEGTLIVGASGELTITDTRNNGLDIFNNTNNQQIDGTLTIERTRDGIALTSEDASITLGETSTVTLNEIELDAIFLGEDNTSCTISGTVMIDDAGQDGLDVEGGGTLEITSTAEVTLDNIDVDAVYLDSNNSTFILGGKLTVLGAEEDGIDVFRGEVSIEENAEVSITNVTENGINGRGSVFENEGLVSVDQCGGFEIRGSFDNLPSGTVQVDGRIRSNNFELSNNSTLAPGTSPGCITFVNAESFADANINIEIEGTTSCTDYDQITVQGTVTLNNAVLNLSGSYAPMVAESFTVIDNDGTVDAVVGTFLGLPEGATILFNDAELIVSYVGGDGNDVVLTVTTVVPVELLGFKATTQKEAILLEWATASELNNDHFLLERSTNGKQFQPITKIQGAGTTLVQQDYHFLDESPIAGTNYYRLKQVDFDGSFEYSMIRAANWDNTTSTDFEFFPSPAQDFITIQTAEQGQLQIFDADGRIVLERTITATLVIDLHHLHSGVYFLKLNDSTQRLLIE